MVSYLRHAAAMLQAGVAVIVLKLNTGILLSLSDVKLFIKAK